MNEKKGYLPPDAGVNEEILEEQSKDALTAAYVRAGPAQLSVAEVLDRVLRDPSIPIDRLERVLALVERREDDDAKARWADAMSMAQNHLGAISKDMSNPQTRSRYASLAQVDAAIRPVYTEQGFSIVFTTRKADQEGWIIVVCEVGLGKCAREFELPLPVSGLGPKGQPVMTLTHAMTAAITYARRTLLKMAFNLAETDIDGNVHEEPEGLSIEQISALTTAILEKGRTVKEFCDYARIEALSELEATRFEAALNYVKRLEPREHKDGDPRHGAVYSTTGVPDETPTHGGPTGEG